MAKVTEDKKWQAESDAYTMAQYEEIVSDPTRRAAAIKAAKEKADDLNKRANAMNKVANTKSSSKPSKSSSTKSKKK